MSLDPRYITNVSLEPYLVNNLDGTPLSGGTIEFWQDDDRTVPKLVYELSGAPPNYTYTALPNPLTISSVGTIVDNSGNACSIYYFPYDANDNIQLYYIVVRDSTGTIQFTRQAWPNLTTETNPLEAEANISNELSNPQFVDINFGLTNPLTINFTGAITMTVAIAPRWDLIISSSATGTVTIQRTAVVGTSQYPGNPPYTLTVTPGLNVSALTLRQRLANNPDIWAPAVGGVDGWVSASVLLAPSSNLVMLYQPNGQVTQTLLNANNTGGTYAQFNATVQLSAGNNTNNGDTGYVDILLDLPVVGATTLSNVQIVGLEANVPDVAFDQITANRQRDQLFNYYGPLLEQKPLPSYLVGWDFPLNPTQPLGPTVAASSAGANTSHYVWDQTIVFQSANSGPAISRASSGSGALRVTATNTTQFAIIQYLPQAIARKILNQSMLSANVAAFTAQVSGLVGTISLWYTTDVSLPSTASNNSIVLSLDANGKPATFNGAWTEVSRNGLGNAQFTVGNSSDATFNDYAFNNWSLNGDVAANTATWFAIVIGFATVTAGQHIDIGSVSLVPGAIPTRPAPQAPDDVIEECQYYFEMSFQTGVVPAQNLGVASGESYGARSQFAGGLTYCIPLTFNTKKYISPTVTIYNTSAANAQIRNLVSAADFTGSTATNVSKASCILTGTSDTGAIGDACAANWVADSRLGV
ncbi:MAG: hypothetical protein V4568_18025 [Pseudomonadota bacterium]